jgi:dTDP-4-dehydrorhamnose reductase
VKVLVFGATGQVGRELTRADWPSDTEVIRLSRPPYDITDANAINAALTLHTPDLIINAAAYTAVDKAESDVAAAFAVNDYGPSLLAAATACCGIPLIHLSTDYVFDGTFPVPYRESDPVAPINVYGRSKAAGEASVRLRQPRAVIVRTSWVYASHGHNFLRTMLRLAREREEIVVVDDQVGTPTSAQSIATALVTISQSIVKDRRAGIQGRWGTYHFTDAGETTWYGFAKHIFSYMEARGLRVPRLRSITTKEYPTPAQRPANSRLDCSLIERTFGNRRVPWPQAVERALDELIPGPKHMPTDRHEERIP